MALDGGIEEANEANANDRQHNANDGQHNVNDGQHNSSDGDPSLNDCGTSFDADHDTSAASSWGL